jgi:hypothetical protein
MHNLLICSDIPCGCQALGDRLVGVFDQSIDTRQGWYREVPAKQGGTAKTIYPSPLPG